MELTSRAVRSTGARVLIFLVAVSAAWSAPLVSGRVEDAATGEGLLGANVQLVEALRGTATGPDGGFRLHLPAAGTWTLRVTHIGYRTVLHSVHAAEGDSIFVRLALAADFLTTDEVVVTAQARESTARLSTTRVEVVGATEIARRAPGTLDKVLDAVPGVEVHRTGGAVVSNVSIRGSSDMLGGGVGNRTLLLVDGKPANVPDTDGAGWWLYPDDIIERVEVVKGAYSALYGSNAMGGVVNLITRTPSHRRVTRLHAAYGLYERPPARIAYTERRRALSTLSFSHSNSIGRFGYVANATRRASDGWRQSSAYDNVSTFSKLKYDLSPVRTLTLSTLYVTGENEYPKEWVRRDQPLRVAERGLNDLQRKRSLSADLLYRRLESPHSGYTVRGFYNRDLTRSLLNPPSDPLPENIPPGFQTRSLSQKFGLQVQSTRLLPYQNTLIFGTDLIWDEIDGQPETHLYGRQGAFSPAVYAQNEYHPLPAWHVTVGARFDYRHLRGGPSTHQLSPKIGLSYEMWQQLVLRASAGHAFRNPSFAEMFLKKVGTQDYEFEPNPDLRHETVNFGEVGCNWHYEDYLAVDGSVFLYRYRDIIRWRELAPLRYRSENMSTAEVRGFELSAHSAWPRRLRQHAALTHLATEIEYLAREGNEWVRRRGPLTYVPEWRLFYSAAYDFGGLRLSADVRYVSETDTVVFFQYDRPAAYTVINLQAEIMAHQNTRLALGVDNVTNEQYEEMERYRMPPRTFRIELVYDFDPGQREE